ncbi:survival of motor neuron-related-splicing factor 30-like [Centruroides sculpturatus]|uniref:survival of motor neuron-related-splicing factor 30-like n=1 Tax=Centruroides sculpturatus TaxID=218467 RepID=UPI000C6DFABF|nr:survival of motor neuron-related-splicing factor 30-like [Centruroides sculpturatus]
MAEELKNNIQSYQIQLQQVEAALTTEPESEELLKLKKDLLEVLNLSKELLNANEPDALPTSSLHGAKKKARLELSKWNPGDRCLAPWSEDGQFYEATIEEITEDGQCTVNFHGYGNTEVALVTQLKTIDKDTLGDDSDGGPKSKKQMVQAKREYKKKKAQKKAQRMKQIEEEREKEKSKWQQFNAKAFSKSKKGQVKKSIFASPDNINGRVGVGTCGIGGRPMTEYHQQEKWRRPMTAPPPAHGMTHTGM